MVSDLWLFIFIRNKTKQRKKKHRGTSLMHILPYQSLITDLGFIYIMVLYFFVFKHIFYLIDALQLILGFLLGEMLLQRLLNQQLFLRWEVAPVDQLTVRRVQDVRVGRVELQGRRHYLWLRIKLSSNIFELFNFLTAL